MADSLDHLTCPVCLDIFNQPRALFCGHILCLDCVNQIQSPRKLLKCPECRKDHTVPAEGFPPSAITNTLLDKLCSNCRVGQPSSSCECNNGRVAEDTIQPQDETTKYLDNLHKQIVNTQQDITANNTGTLHILADIKNLETNLYRDVQDKIIDLKERLGPQYIPRLLLHLSDDTQLCDDIVLKYWEICHMLIHDSPANNQSFISSAGVACALTHIQKYATHQPILTKILITLYDISLTHADSLICLTGYLLELTPSFDQTTSFYSCQVLVGILFNTDTGHFRSALLIQVINDKIKMAINTWKTDAKMGADMAWSDFVQHHLLLHSSHEIVRHFTVWQLAYALCHDTYKYRPMIERDIGIDLLRRYKVGVVARSPIAVLLKRTLKLMTK